ncbi:MAG: TlpA family protein disulfide reductase [Ignavibacteriae bacterium]|nr:TlpA family protein disulfide reductase [Ignavibacteriota bacterium]
MKNNLAFLFILILLNSCANNKKSNEILITGKLLDKGIEEVKLNLYPTDIAINNIEYFAKVEKDSTFLFKISSDVSLYGNIHIGNFYHKIFLSPNDDLFITNEQDTISYSGQGSEKNNFLYQVVEENGLYHYSRILQKNDTTKHPIILAKEEQIKFVKIIEENKNKYKLSSEFVNFLKLNDLSSYEGFLMYYKLFSNKKNDKVEDSLEINKEFERIKFVNKFIDDKKLSTPEYFYNMRNFVYAKTNIFMKKSELKYQSDLQNTVQIIFFDSLIGKSKSYAIADWLINDFNFNIYDTIIYDRFKKEIKDSLALKVVKKSYDKYVLKQQLINKPLNEEFNKTELEDDKGNLILFEDMIKKYKGKLVYLDIWSLGCGPCIANMPRSKELKEKLKNYPIEFVYLTTDNKFDTLWQEVYKVSLTNENHYRLVKGFDSRILKFLNINWVPNYMLIDKDNKLISFNALGPHDAKCEEEIRKYLN